MPALGYFRVACPRRIPAHVFKVLGYPQVIRLNYLQVIDMGIDVCTKIDNVNSHNGKQQGKLRVVVQP